MPLNLESEDQVCQGQGLKLNPRFSFIFRLNLLLSEINLAFGRLLKKFCDDEKKDGGTRMRRRDSGNAVAAVKA